MKELKPRPRSGDDHTGLRFQESFIPKQKRLCLTGTSQRREDKMTDTKQTEREAYHAGYQAGYEQGKRDAVRHGEWINEHILDDEWYHTCSNCNTEIRITFFDSRCPNCGAKMDGKESGNG